MAQIASESQSPAAMTATRWHARRFGLNLRVRIFLLLLIAVFPAIAIEAYNEFDLRRAREAEIRDRVVQITKQFGAEMGELREGARQMLLVLGQLPPVKAKQAASCSSLFATLQPQYANYTMLGAADADGNVFCSSDLRAYASVAQQEFFKRAMARDGLSVGNYWVDPMSGQKEIHFANRFYDADGNSAGVVFAALNLGWLVDRLKEPGLSPGASILIADRLGNIIARLPDPEAMVGKNMRKSHEAFMDGDTAGWDESVGVDGVTRIFGYVPAQLPPYDFFLSAGLSKAEAFAAIDQASLRGFSLIGLGLALAAYLAWYGGRMFIYRPVNSLLEATKQWRAGDYASRIRVRDSGSEIGALGQAFNEMVDALAARDQAQKLAEENLRRLNATLEERVEHRTEELANANRLLKDEINERERVQSELLHAQKIEAIGQLTSGIAHDFNNLLTAILGNLRVALRRVQDEKVAKPLETATRAARRGAKLVGDLLAFSRRQRLDLQPVEVNGLLSSSADIFERALGSLVRVHFDRDPNLWKAMTDPTQLEFAILNLAINARDAMPMGGTITITTANVPAGDPRLPEYMEGDFVMVAVRDTGSGMSEEVRAKVFEPFFTTKAIGRGSGLGLSMVYGLVRQCKGHIHIDTRIGHGTTVAMFFSRATADTPAQIPGSGIDDGANVAPARPGARLLVVDDDNDVREFVATALREAGYVVHEASDAEAGLAALSDEPDIALLITDYAMPFVTGLDLFRRARVSRPDLSAVLITGFANLPVDDPALSQMHILRKPFDLPDILRAVNQCWAEAKMLEPQYYRRLTNQ